MYCKLTQDDVFQMLLENMLLKLAIVQLLELRIVLMITNESVEVLEVYVALC